MAALFKNRELKNFSIYFIIISSICLMILTACLSANIKNVNETYIKQSIGVMGGIIKEHPEIEIVIVKNYIKGYSEDYAYGREILKKYSYNEYMGPYKNQLLRQFYNQYFADSLIIASVLIFLLYTLTLLQFGNFFSKVREFQEAAGRIVEGDFSQTFDDSKEGDLYLLSHQFNQMSMRLKETIEALKAERNRLKDIISDITHQLKTPLASLIMFNELMMQDPDMQREERMKFLNISKNQLDRIEWLIKNLLKMARFEAGVVLFNKTQAPIYNTITAALDGINEIAKQKSVDIVIQKDKESTLVHDTDWTAEALSNIIKNSVEHSRQNGTVTISCEETPLSLQIVVADKGEGIRSSELPRIFDRFYKGENSTNPMSIGIGLYIAKTIIENQQGSISVESKEGHGTKFVITFLKTVI